MLAYAGSDRLSKPSHRGSSAAASRAGPVSQRRVSTVESRAPAQLGEAQPDDLIALDDPEQAVTSSIGRRPERAEASILVDVPLALRGTTVRLNVARVPAYLERLRRPVVEEQLAGRHCSRDQGGRNRLAVNDLDILQPVHRITLPARSGRLVQVCRTDGDSRGSSPPGLRDFAGLREYDFAAYCAVRER